MKCRCCPKELTKAEEMSYGSRCEDCWASEPDKGTVKMPYSAADCYSGERVVEKEELRPL